MLTHARSTRELPSRQRPRGKGRLYLAWLSIVALSGGCQLATPALVDVAIPVSRLASGELGVTTNNMLVAPSTRQRASLTQGTATMVECSTQMIPVGYTSPSPHVTSESAASPAAAQDVQPVILWMQLPAAADEVDQVRESSDPEYVESIPSLPDSYDIARQPCNDIVEQPWSNRDDHAAPALGPACNSDPCTVPETAGVPCTLPNGVGFWPDDEYLCDGGDQETRVRVARDWNVSGLDLEDTVAHYDTLDGRTVVTPSNRVCIYAPRFAAVRQIVQTSEDDSGLVMHAVAQPLPAISEDGSHRPQLVDAPLPPERDTLLQGPLALRHRTRGLDMLHALPVMELVRDFEAHEDFQIIRLGIHQTSERALVEEHAEAALVWTDNLAPEVMLDLEPAEVDVTVAKIGTEYHIGLEGAPRLRVIKLASTSAALPGEEVTFTLRFDNTGDQTIGNVTIMDNLTTRLEYVPDSAQCSMKAEFFQDENQGESLALRWEIRDPVRPGEGGIIRFRCRVR